MKIQFIVLLSIFCGFCNTAPYFLLPRCLLLEPRGFSFIGTLGEQSIQGWWLYEPLFQNGVLVGQKNYNNMSLAGTEYQFYGVSLLNGTYLQATVDTDGHCVFPFVEDLNCTDWNPPVSQSVHIKNGTVSSSTCTFVRRNSTTKGEMKLSALVENQHLVNYMGMTIVDGVSNNLFWKIVVETIGILPSPFPVNDCGFV